MDPNSKRFRDEKKTMEVMLALYCRDNHGSNDQLCASCRELLEYAMARLEKCPFGIEKPTCSKCLVHCYKPEMRERVKEVMRYSGPRLIKSHPVLALKHVAHGIIHRPKAKKGKDAR